MKTKPLDVTIEQKIEALEREVKDWEEKKEHLGVACEEIVLHHEYVIKYSNCALCGLFGVKDGSYTSNCRYCPIGSCAGNQKLLAVLDAMENGDLPGTLKAMDDFIAYLRDLADQLRKQVEPKKEQPFPLEEGKWYVYLPNGDKQPGMPFMVTEIDVERVVNFTPGVLFTNAPQLTVSDVRTAMTEGRYIEIPPRPKTWPIGYRLTGVVREPSGDVAGWDDPRMPSVFCSFATGARPDIDYYSGYRWIVEEVEPKHDLESIRDGLLEQVKKIETLIGK